MRATCVPPRSPPRAARTLSDALLAGPQPMAFLVEQAGGLATTGTERILDIKPTDIHQRCPVFLGSKDDVEDVMRFHQ